VRQLVESQRLRQCLGCQLLPRATIRLGVATVAVRRRLRVEEQDSTRSVVALDGPAGEVNVALVTSTNGKARTICSWKFETVAP
jgi:hypothetical protein